MKKLILSVSALVGLSTAAMAQGTITLDGTQGTGTISIAGALDTTQDINFELLYSATGTAGTFSPVATLLNSSSVGGPTGTALGQTYTASGDITGEGSGQLYDLSGAAFILPVAAGGTAYFEAEAWTGTGTVYGGSGVYSATSPIFTEVLSSATSPTQAGLSNIGNLNLVQIVPEPSTLAMSGLGLASMLFFRRRK